MQMKPFCQLCCRLCHIYFLFKDKKRCWWASFSLTLYLLTGQPRSRRTRGTMPRSSWWGTNVTWRTNEWSLLRGAGSCQISWVSLLERGTSTRPRVKFQFVTRSFHHVWNRCCRGSCSRFVRKPQEHESKLCLIISISVLRRRHLEAQRARKLLFLDKQQQLGKQVTWCRTHIGQHPLNNGVTWQQSLLPLSHSCWSCPLIGTQHTHKAQCHLYKRNWSSLVIMICVWPATRRCKKQLATVSG